MCGIAGFVGFPRTGPNALGDDMRRAIRYRGRDGEGQWIGSGVRFFHSRLSVIAPADGAQPMQDRTGRYVIVFNGEIYNYLELRKTYAQAGARFQTASDTEVILEGFRLKGPAVCDDLNGMFAFAIWDRHERTLFLARDRLGKKPLYYAELGGVFYFASTLDAFRTAPGWTGAISASAVDCYRAIGSFPPGRTIFHQARSLPPAARATYSDRQNLAIDIYWRPDFSRKQPQRLESAIDELEELLSDAIDIRLRADVPVALTFSGGADSGLIAALAQKRLGKSLQCWTLDYDAPEERSEERGIAERTAALLGLDWQFLNFDYYDRLLPTLDRAMSVVDQPCTSMALSYSLHLYESIKPHATVTLTGNGSDELFLGYTGNEELVARDLAQPGKDLSWLRRLLSRSSARGKFDFAFYQSDYVRANMQGDSTDREEAVHDIYEEIRAANVASHADLYCFSSLQYFTVDSNFRLPDIAGLAAQVEVRSPFLDHRIYEFAARLPSNLKVLDERSPATNKYLIKKCYERYVPADIAWASKKGMCANLNWDVDMARNPQWETVFAEQLGSIEEAGLPTAEFATAWQQFVTDKRAGIRYPDSCGMAMAGLMLGFWMKRQKSLDASVGEQAA